MAVRRQKSFAISRRNMLLMILLMLTGSAEVLLWWNAYRTTPLETIGNTVAATIDERLIDNLAYRTELFKNLSAFNIVDVLISDSSSPPQVTQEGQYYIYQTGNTQIFFSKSRVQQEQQRRNLKDALFSVMIFLITPGIIFLTVTFSYVIPSHRLAQIIQKQISEEHIHPLPVPKNNIGRNISSSYNFLIQAIAKKQNNISTLLFRVRENVGSLNPLIIESERGLNQLIETEQSILTEFMEIQQKLQSIQTEEQMQSSFMSAMTKNIEHTQSLSLDFHNNIEQVFQNLTHIQLNKDRKTSSHQSLHQLAQQNQTVVKETVNLLSKIESIGSQSMVMTEELYASANQLNLMAVNAAITVTHPTHNSMVLTTFSEQLQNLSQKILENTKISIEKLAEQNDLISKSERKYLLIENQWKGMEEKLAILQREDMEIFNLIESTEDPLNKIVIKGRNIISNIKENYILIQDFKETPDEQSLEKSIGRLETLKKKSESMLKNMEVQVLGRNPIAATLESTQDVISLLLQMHSDIKISVNGKANSLSD